MKRRMVTLSVRMSAADKTAWQALCLSQNTTSSNGVRDVIRKLLGACKQSQVAVVSSEAPDASRCRIEVRLTESERRALDKLSEMRGASANILLVQIARAFVTNQPCLSFDDAKEIRESNERLLAVGRNLNQLVKSVNAGALQQIDESVLKQVHDQVLSHTQLISRAVRACTERWEVTWRGL